MAPRHAIQPSQNRQKNMRSANIARTILSAALLSALSFSAPAFAGLPTTALPASGTVTGPATISSGSNALQVSVGGNAVITWAGGFNIGSAASVTVNGTAAGSIPALLNIDTSGNPSELAGSLTASNASVFIANQNGVIVDGTANLSAPQGTLGLIAAPVDASAFTSSGSFTIKGGAPTQLTLNDGATINDSRMLLAGVGAVNIGNIINTSSMSAGLYVGEGTDATNMQVITPSAATGGFGAPGGGIGAVKGTSTSVTLAAGATLNAVYVFRNYSDGTNTINGTLAATPQLYGQAYGGWLFYNGGNLTGSGVIQANQINYNGWGDWNNVTSTSNYLANGFKIAPLAGVPGAIAGQPSAMNVMIHTLGSGNQHINLDGGNNSVSVFSSPQTPNDAAYQPATMNSLASFVPNGGDGLIVQAGTVGTGIGIGEAAFAFPGSVVLIGKQVVQISGNLNNAWTGSGQPFQGMFFEAPQIYMPNPSTTLITNGNNWVNFSTAPIQLPAAVGSLQASGGLNITPTSMSDLVHMNTYSSEIQAAAAGQNWTALVNYRPIHSLLDFSQPPVHQ
jgi:filamentous hemagglutinin family protein